MITRYSIFPPHYSLLYKIFRQIHCLDVLLEDNDVVKAITEYVSYAAIENLVIGATSRHGFIR